MPERDLDDFIVRIDERTLNIWRTLEDIKKHQESQNGKLEEFCFQVNRNTVWRRVMLGILGVAIPIVWTALIILFLSVP